MLAYDIISKSCNYGMRSDANIFYLHWCPTRTPPWRTQTTGAGSNETPASNLKTKRMKLSKQVIRENDCMEVRMESIQRCKWQVVSDMYVPILRSKLSRARSTPPWLRLKQCVQSNKGIRNHNKIRLLWIKPIQLVLTVIWDCSLAAFSASAVRCASMCWNTMNSNGKFK